MDELLANLGSEYDDNKEDSDLNPYCEEIGKYFVLDNSR